MKYGNLTSSDSSWAVGAVVEFACDPGYTLEQGSVTIECADPNNPQWNETEPACRGPYVTTRSGTFQHVVLYLMSVKVQQITALKNNHNKEQIIKQLRFS